MKHVKVSSTSLIFLVLPNFQQLAIAICINKVTKLAKLAKLAINYIEIVFLERSIKY